LGSLAPVFAYLKTKIPLSFIDDVAGPAAHQAAGALQDGHALLLENIRRNKGEEGNDWQFAKELASLADIYVNDAFPVSHRSHASIVSVPELLPSYAGFQFLAEVKGLTPALSPTAPSLAVLGGAKLVTKITLLKSLLAKYDRVFVGGALANDFLAAKGYEVGKSLVSGTGAAAELLFDPKIILPETVVVSNPAGKDEKPSSGVGRNDVISDIAASSIESLRSLVEKAGSILWNGPMGHFETGFTEGTDALAELIAGAPGKTIVGGGDTLASIQSLDLLDKFTFVSTAGGAMLDFLANGTLPGIQALENSTARP
jgi:phosphoglycerate kinase